MFHISMMLGLIAMSLGIILLIWGLRNQGRGVCLAQTFGAIVLVLSILSMLCSSYVHYKIWHKAITVKSMIRGMDIRNSQTNTPSTDTVGR